MTTHIIRGQCADGTMYWMDGGWATSPYDATPLSEADALDKLSMLKAEPKGEPDEHVYAKSVLPAPVKPGPYNEQVHAHLIELGYTRRWNEDSFEDDGDGESGPHLTGGPAFDEYTSAEDYVIIEEGGHFAHYEKRDPELEKWIDQQQGGQ